MATGRQRGGRPRDSRLDHEVLRAAREILEEVGYVGLTVDAVAARAVVSRAVGAHGRAHIGEVLPHNSPLSHTAA